MRYALAHLAKTDFRVVLLTNERTLSQSSYEFLADNGIELFLTQNHGFDFGMWKRYLHMQAISNSENENIERLLLINDSVVYYQDKFEEYFEQAEKSHADVVSLTSNDEFAPHLQSFFLYMKPAALGVFFMHLFETPEQENFYDVTRRLEVALSEKFGEADVKMESLYHTERPVFFAYKELIEQGAGFVKRKLLQRRFSYEEKKHFVRYHAYDALNENYLALIKKAGFAPDFKAEWFPRPCENPIARAKDFVWEKAFQLVGFPAKRFIDRFKK